MVTRVVAPSLSHCLNALDILNLVPILSKALLGAGIFVFESARAVSSFHRQLDCM